MRSGGELACSALLWLLACSNGNGRTRPVAIDEQPDSGISALDAGPPDSTPDAAPANPEDDAGSASCGDGVSSDGEECDGEDVAGQACASFGFDRGTLGCTRLCTIDTAGCSGEEGCGDGIDNDGDGRADCSDDECQTFCQDPCSAPLSIGDPALLSGDNFDKADTLEASCSVAGATGPEIVYALTPATTGVLDAYVVSSKLMSLSVRGTCAAAASELACGFGLISVPVTQGETLYLVVEGAEAADVGTFEIDVRSRSIGCGDFHRDAGEACDDGDLEDGDGCDAQCELEASETEPNGGVGSAGAYLAPYFASIGQVGDVDVVSFQIESTYGSVVAQTFDFGDGTCSRGEADSFIEILSSNGQTVLAADDDSGDGLCAKASATGLTSGTYLARIKAFENATPNTFPYRLSIVTDDCGNGTRTEAEGCDDGNSINGDGCDERCQAE